MTRGPKPIPTALKLLAGNPGRRPLNSAEPQAPQGAPQCPAHLKGEARREWGRITTELDSMGILFKVDRAALATYCQHWKNWHEATKRLQTEGMISTTPNGHLQPSPLVSIANQAASAMLKSLVEFGLTPSSRSRIKAPQKAKAKTPAEDFFGDLE